MINPGSNAVMENNVDRETVRLWRVFKTVNQMIRDRGFVVIQGFKELSLKDFVSTFAPGGIVIEYLVSYN